MTSATACCNTRRTAADQVRIPGVLRLPGWFQKTDAALASQTVSGPVDMIESRIVQSQTLRTLQPLYHCRVTDRVEGGGEIEANKQCDFLAVSRSVDAA